MLRVAKRVGFVSNASAGDSLMNLVYSMFSAPLQEEHRETLLTSSGGFGKTHVTVSGQKPHANHTEGEMLACANSVHAHSFPGQALRRAWDAVAPKRSPSLCGIYVPMTRLYFF